MQHAIRHGADMAQSEERLVVTRSGATQVEEEGKRAEKRRSMLHAMNAPKPQPNPKTKAEVADADYI